MNRTDFHVFKTMRTEIQSSAKEELQNEIRF